MAPRRVQTVLALVAAVGFATLRPGARPRRWLAIGRFITGLGIAGALIAMMKANVQWYPPHRLAAVTGVGGVHRRGGRAGGDPAGAGAAAAARLARRLPGAWRGWAA